MVIKRWRTTFNDILTVAFIKSRFNVSIILWSLLQATSYKILSNSRPNSCNRTRSSCGSKTSTSKPITFNGRLQIVSYASLKRFIAQCTNRIVIVSGLRWLNISLAVFPHWGSEDSKEFKSHITLTCNPPQTRKLPALF